MMPKTLTLFFLAMPLALFSQRHGYLKYGLGFSYHHDLFSSNDPTARFKPSKQVTTEFLYDQYITDYFSVEGGIRDKYVESRIDFYDTDTTQLLLAGNFLAFPLRVKFRVPFLKKFLFTSGMGASILISHAFTGIDKSVTAPYEETMLVKDFPRKHFTFDLTAGLHFLISPSWKATVEYTYNVHSGTIAEAQIQNMLRSTSSRIISKGTYHLFMIGIGYRLSEIWIKKNKRSQ